MLVESGVGAPEDIERATDGVAGARPVRSVAGGHGPREPPRRRWRASSPARRSTANQIEFVNLIVNHLTEHGVMEAAMLYESPFTDLTPRGPDGLFTSAQVDELVGVLNGVRETALAA